MTTNLPNHEPVADADELRRAAAWCGPASGSWVTYGLGTENQNLPGFIALCPGRISDQGVAELAVRIPARRVPGHLRRHPPHRHRTPDREHPQSLPDARGSSGGSWTCSTGSTRGISDSVAARLRCSRHASSPSSSLTGCSARPPRRSTSSRSRSRSGEMYGPGTQARQLLIARRLIERGVRFVQVWHGAGQPWDNHDRHPAPSRARPANATRRSPRCSRT